METSRKYTDQEIYDFMATYTQQLLVSNQLGHEIEVTKSSDCTDRGRETATLNIKITITNA